MQRVCVFCGSQMGSKPLYAEAARQFGAALVRRGLGLVFGAGHIGLMGVVADAVRAAGGETIGVIPRMMVERELAHNGLTRLEVVETMHQRKALMADLSDAFVALPGGYGTCDELFEIVTWAQLRLHVKPVGLLNVAGFFDPLLLWADHMLAEGFLKPKHRDLLLTATEAEELLDRLASYRPPEGLDRWLDPAAR
jgi:uncharacterized protein (TIGR00730 family)